MGLKNHVEDGTGHILSLGLDLDYLHVEGAERQAGLSVAAGAENVGVLQVRAGALSSSSSSSAGCSYRSSSSSSCSTFSEGSAASDSEDETKNPRQGPFDLRRQESEPPNRPPEETSPQTDPVTDCRTKVDFALKLGYSEELVLLVLRKLGPDALINDMLGELVKLGTKTETEQQGGPTVSQSSPLVCSSSSLDSCRLLCSSQLLEDKENLRPVVVDGSNVAMSHGNKEVFSCQGIQLAVDWFLERGHRDVTVFVPAWRKEQSRPDALITDQEILRRLEKEKILVFTPSRRVQGRRVVCYDDRFIVKLAYESDGIIVSNDNYRDLANEKPEWKKFIDERLLMFSFVNDKFMPPDDPLGRHGPSLENFLRKRPVIPENRKQPCPYGKKCTYGHKCKFYHPERGSQPQRAVADELRACAKMSSVASRSLLEDALMAKSQSPPGGAGEDEPRRALHRKQSSSSPKSVFTDVQEDEGEGCRGGTSRSSSYVGPAAPGGPSSSGASDWWERTGASAGSSSRVAGAHRCQSPDVGYSSLVKSCSSLSLVVPPSPECFYPADLRPRSLPSDCSSDGSASSDSFSPDPLLDEGPKCHHHHHHHRHSHHTHHCSGQFSRPASRVPPGLGQPLPQGFAVPPTRRKPYSLGLEEPSFSVTSHSSPLPSKTPSAYIPSHLQHPALSNFSRESPAPPPHGSTFHSHSQVSLRGSVWEEGGLGDSRVYKGSPLYSRRNYSGLNQQAQHQINWEPDYQQSPEPRYDTFSVPSRPDVLEKTWRSPWGRPTHSSPRGPSASSLPSIPQLPLSPIAPHSRHLPSLPQTQEPASFGQYQDLRERMFVNLCGIFPPHLVRTVMSRCPHVMDAQEIAAVILMERSQRDS